MAQVRAAVALSLIPGLGPVRAARLLRAFGGDAEEALQASPGQWRERAEVEAPLHPKSRLSERLGAADEILRRCRKLGLYARPLYGPGYPPELTQVHDPPTVLYLKGDPHAIEQYRRTIAIVGTRRPSTAGLDFVRQLAGRLSGAGAIVVSGLAVGIDAAAHQAVVEAAGVGVAVLPRGLDRVYPEVNRLLAQRLAERGCLVSEYPPGAGANRGSFVARNRIISGLARAVAVVEAGASSGALGTVQFALDAGRSVFVMPGRPGDPRVAGSLELLRDGAAVLLGAGEIAQELGLALGGTTPELPDELGSAGKLLKAGPSTFDDLLAASGLALPDLLTTLGKLELSGAVSRGEDGLYYLTGVRSRS